VILEERDDRRRIVVSSIVRDKLVADYLWLNHQLIDQIAVVIVLAESRSENFFYRPTIAAFDKGQVLPAGALVGLNHKSR